jgi:hypothetical protein
VPDSLAGMKLPLQLEHECEAEGDVLRVWRRL